MAKTVVTNYETVAVEKEKYECDHCGTLVGEDEINTIVYGRGDELSNRNGITIKTEDATTKHLCEECVGLREALTIREKKAYLRTWWQGTRKHLAWVSLLVPTFALGMATMRVAYASHQNVEDPIWAVDIFSGFFFSLLLAFCGGVLATVIDNRINDD